MITSYYASRPTPCFMRDKNASHCAFALHWTWMHLPDFVLRPHFVGTSPYFLFERRGNEQKEKKVLNNANFLCADCTLLKSKNCYCSSIFSSKLFRIIYKRLPCFGAIHPRKHYHRVYFLDCSTSTQLPFHPSPQKVKSSYSQTS